MFCTSQYFYEKSEITYFSVKVQWKLHQDDSLINKSPKTFPNRVFYILQPRKNKNFIKIYRKDPSGKRIYMEVIDTDRNSIPDAVVETTVLRYNTKSEYRQLWHTSGKYNSFEVLLSHWILVRLFTGMLLKFAALRPNEFETIISIKVKSHSKTRQSKSKKMENLSRKKHRLRVFTLKFF